MKALHYSILVLILLTTSIACNRVGSGIYGFFDRARYQSSVDSCLNQNASYRIHNTVLSLEVLTEKNDRLGFDLGRGFLKFFGLRHSVQSAKLSMTTKLSTTKQENRSAIIETSDAEERNTKLNFNLGIISSGEINCDDGSGTGIVVGGTCIERIRATPINDLIRDALDEGIKRIVYGIDRLEDEWNTRITERSDTLADHYVIPVGNYQNVRKGDVFTVHNVEHQFAGPNCGEDSVYLGPIKTTRRPIAHVRVVDVYPHASLVQVIPEYVWYINGTPSHKYIQYGALVEMASPDAFVNEDGTPRQLYRTLELGIVRSLILPMNTAPGAGGGTELTPGTQAGSTFSSRNAILLNVTPLLCENLEEIANANGFSIYTDSLRTQLAKCGTDEATLERLFYEDLSNQNPDQGNTLEGLIRNTLGNPTNSGLGGIPGQQGINTGGVNQPTGTGLGNSQLTGNF